MYSAVFNSASGAGLSTDVGAMLRAAREAAGVSLGNLATRTNFSKSHLANIERGRRKATPDVVLAYERTLGDDVRRRGLVTGLAATLVAPMVAAEIIEGAFVTALGERVPIDEWQARAESYGRDYMSLGAGELSARLISDMLQLQQHLGTPAEFAVAARLMTVYGKTLPSADADKGAIRWYRLAALTADRSEDLLTRIWVRGRSALALAYEGAGLTTAQTFADQAVALSGKPSLGLLNALVARAHIAGFKGDSTSAIKGLEQAQRVFDIAGSHEQISDFAVPEWRMATFGSMLLSRLGDPKAIEAQETADRTRPQELTRFATHIELHRGLMMAKEGDKTGGVTYARTALNKLPPERHSLSLRLMMAEIKRAAA